MEPAIIYFSVSILLVVTGFAGLIFPVLPGAPLLFAGLALAAWTENFVYIGPWVLGLLGVLALLTYAVDIFASAFCARRFGASSRALWGAGLGAFVGIFFGIPGILLGPFVGAVLGELSARRSLGQAGLSGIGATLGLIIGAAAKFALGFSMLGVFILFRFVLVKP